MTVPEAPEGGPGEEVGAPPESTERSAKLEEDIPVWGKELWAEDDLRWDFIHFQRRSKTFEDFHRVSQHFFDVCYELLSCGCRAAAESVHQTNELLIAHGGTLGTAHRWVPCGLLTPRLGWQHRVVTVRMRWAGSFGSGVCLDDAVPESERQYIQDDQGRR